MIYTITFNPAIDLVMSSDEFDLGTLNRVKKQDFVVGGKGINISTLLREFDLTSTASGFIGGFTGNFIKESLEENGTIPKFIDAEGNTRVNVKLKAGEETEINGSGPVITEKEFNLLYQMLDQDLTEKDTLFLAGNTANGLGETSYTKIAQLCKEKGVRFIVDSNKTLLTECLEYEPFLIKPNQDELEEIFGTEISTLDEIKTYAKELQSRGARNVLVSRGGDGAVLLTEDGDFYSSNVPEGEVVNSVGSGDSMLAGFVAKYLETGDYPESLKQGAATGSATAFSVGIAKRNLIEELVKQIEVTNISGKV